MILPYSVTPTSAAAVAHIMQTRFSPTSLSGTVTNPPLTISMNSTLASTMSISVTHRYTILLPLENRLSTIVKANTAPRGRKFWLFQNSREFIRQYSLRDTIRIVLSHIFYLTANLRKKSHTYKYLQIIFDKLGVFLAQSIIFE